MTRRAWILRPRTAGALLVAVLMAGPEFVGAAFADPPPWAPAHGYRAKHKDEHRHRHRHRHGDVDFGHSYATSAPVAVPETGFGNCNRAMLGSLLGAAAGGALGSQIGSGSGKTAAVIGGTIIGALVGHSIGNSMDRIDQNCVGQTLESAETGRTVKWVNPDSGNTYQVTPTRTYQMAGGSYCREYTTEVMIGGRKETAVGTACRQADGSWKTSN